MGLFADIGDWVKGAFNDAKNWLYTQLSAARDWVIQAINDVTDQIKLLKYRFRKTVSGWLNDPVGFWLVIAGFAALAVFLPSIVSFVTGTVAYKAVVAAIESVKAFTGTFLAKIGYIQLLSLHKIGLIFIPEYQDFWGKLDAAFAGMAEEIELGVGTINVLMQNVRNLYYSTYSMFGFNSDMIESTFYDDVTKWTAKAQKKWEKYVLDPASFFTDIQKDLIYPALEKQAIAGEDAAKLLLDVNTRVQELVAHSDDVRKDVNSLIAGLPDDIEKSVLDKIGEGLKAVNTYYDEKLLPFMAKVDEASELIGTTIAEVKQAMEENSRKDNTFIGLLRQALLSGDLDATENRTLLTKLLLKIQADSSESFIESLNVSLLKQTTDLESDTDTDIIVPTVEPSAPVRISLEFTSDVSGGWFVGEY